VVAQGTTFALGQDLTLDSDRCPDEGRAMLPSIFRDGTLAFFASASSGRLGQDRLDLPWTLFLQEPGKDPQSVLDGVRWPRGLHWLSEDRVVFSGAVGDAAGIWSVQPDGKGLTLITDEVPSWLTVAPDGAHLAGILDQPGADVTFVRTYDLTTAGL
jgi:hypothetical protein